MILSAILTITWGCLISVVAIAQLVEHRIVIPVVAGSSPVGHPKFPATIPNAKDNSSGSPPNVGALGILLAAIGFYS